MARLVCSRGMFNLASALTIPENVNTNAILSVSQNPIWVEKEKEKKKEKRYTRESDLFCCGLLCVQDFHVWSNPAAYK